MTKDFELELIQSHMAQKPMLRGEVGCACVARSVRCEACWKQFMMCLEDTWFVAAFHSTPMHDPGLKEVQRPARVCVCKGASVLPCLLSCCCWRRRPPAVRRSRLRAAPPPDACPPESPWCRPVVISSSALLPLLVHGASAGGGALLLPPLLHTNHRPMSWVDQSERIV